MGFQHLVRRLGRARRFAADRQQDGSHQDVSQQRAAQAAFLEREERFGMLLRATAGARWDTILQKDTPWWRDGIREARFTAARDEGGQPDGILCITSDMTEQEKVQKPVTSPTISYQNVALASFDLAEFLPKPHFAEALLAQVHTALQSRRTRLRARTSEDVAIGALDLRERQS